MYPYQRTPMGNPYIALCSGYLWVIIPFGIPREHNKYHGYTVRGTPNGPLKHLQVHNFELHSLRFPKNSLTNPKKSDRVPSYPLALKHPQPIMIVVVAIHLAQISASPCTKWCQIDGNRSASIFRCKTGGIWRSKSTLLRRVNPHRMVRWFLGQQQDDCFLSNRVMFIHFRGPP